VNGYGEVDEVLYALDMLIFEAADAEHKVDGPGAVDNNCGLGEHFLQHWLRDAEIFTA